MKLKQRLWCFIIFCHTELSLKGEKSLVKSNFRALTAFWLQFGITVLITAYQVIPQTSEHDHLSQGKPDLKANFQQSFLFLPNSSNKYGGIIICDITRDPKQHMKFSVFSDSFWVVLISWRRGNTGINLSQLLFQCSLQWSAGSHPFPGRWQI